MRECFKTVYLQLLDAKLSYNKEGSALNGVRDKTYSTGFFHILMTTFLFSEPLEGHCCFRDPNAQGEVAALLLRLMQKTKH